MDDKQRVGVFRARRGLSSLGNLGLLILVVIIGYACYLFVPVYVNYFELGNVLRGIATKSGGIENEDGIKVFALEELSKLGYNIKPEDVTVKRVARITRIHVEYTATVTEGITGVQVSIAFSKDGSNEL